MKKEMKDRLGREAGVRSGIYTVVGVLFVFGLFAVAGYNGWVGIKPSGDGFVEEVETPVRSWKPMVLGANDPGAGVSGVIMSYVVLNGHFGDYSSNLTINGSVMAYTDYNGTHMNSSVNHTVGHDNVLTCRLNTDVYETSNSTWQYNWTRARVTSATHGLTNQYTDVHLIVATADYMWVNFVWDGTLGAGGTGETLTPGQNCTSFFWTIECYTY